MDIGAQCDSLRLELILSGEVSPPRGRGGEGWGGPLLPAAINLLEDNDEMVSELGISMSAQSALAVLAASLSISASAASLLALKSCTAAKATLSHAAICITAPL